VETYWKSTANAPIPLSSPLPLSLTSSTHTSPSNHSLAGAAGQALTVSSLGGDCIYVVVQVTRDFHPVVYFQWKLPGVSLDLGVADVTLTQFQELALKSGKHLDPFALQQQDLATKISNRMVSLTQLLTVRDVD